MSNKPKHTPGPWRLDPDFETRDFYFVDDGIEKPNPPGTDENGPDMLAQVYKCAEVGEGEANAHLIAAAPELWDLLREFTKAFEPIDFNGDDLQLRALRLISRLARHLEGTP